MAVYKTTDLIYVLSTKLGYIPPLRQIGPIINPLRIRVSVAQKCLTIGTPLAQYDPETGIVIKLTAENILDADKFTKQAEINKEILDGTYAEPEPEPEPDPTPAEVLTDTVQTNAPAVNSILVDEPVVQNTYTEEQQKAYDEYISQGYSEADAAELIAAELEE